MSIIVCGATERCKRLSVHFESWVQAQAPPTGESGGETIQGSRAVLQDGVTLGMKHAPVPSPKELK